MCADPISVATELAAGELFECLEAWCGAYHQAVSSYYLRICESIPETVSPLRYAPFLARAFGKTVIRIGGNSSGSNSDATTQMFDLAALETQAGVSVGPFDAAATLPAFLPMSAFLAKDFDENDGAVAYPAGAEALARWVEHRAAEIDRLTGLTDNAAALVRVCSEPPLAVPGLEALAEAMEEVSYAVYGKPQAQALTLEEYLAMDDVERLCVLTRNTTPETIVDVLKKAAKPLLDRCNAPLRKKAYNKECPCILERYFVRTVDEAPAAIAAIIAYRFRAQDRDLFPLVEHALASVVPCITACTLPNAWSTFLAICAGIPPIENFRAADQPTVRPLYTRIAEVRELIETGRRLHEEFAIDHPISFYIDLSGNRADLCALMALISKRMASLRTDADVVALRESMVNVLEGFLKSVPDAAERAAITSEVDSTFFRDLLRFRFFAVAKAFLAQHPELAKSASTAVLAATRSLIDGARSLTDPALAAAKDCLALLEYSSEKAFERNLLSAAKYLARRGVVQGVRPKELRAIMTAADAHRVAALLLPTADPREDLVKAVQEVIPDIPEPKKCEIVLMAARKALDAGLAERALALCDELAAVPYPHAAPLAAELIAKGESVPCTQETRSRLITLCLLSSSRSKRAGSMTPAECLARWRAANPSAHVVATDEERIRFALDYYRTSQRISFAALSTVGTAAAAENRAVFMDILVKAAGHEDFDRTAHFALHFLGARLLAGDAPRDYFAALAMPTTALLRKAFASSSSVAAESHAGVLRGVVEEIRAVAKHRSIARELAKAHREFSPEAFYGGSDEDRKRIFLGLMRSEKDAAAIARLTDASMRCGIPEYELSISTVCWMFSAEYGGTVEEVKDAIAVRKEVLAQYPAVTLRGLADVFPAMPPSDYPRFALYFATIEEFAAKIPRGEGASEDERRVAEELFARAPVKKIGEYKRLITGVARTLPGVDFFRLTDGNSSAVDAMEEWLTPEININACLRLVEPIKKARSDGSVPPPTKNDIYLRWALRSLRPFAVSPADSDESLQKKSAAAAELWATKFKVLKTGLNPESLAKLLDTLLTDVSLFAEHRLAILNEIVPHLGGGDDDEKSKYAGARTALEGQVSQRAFLPEKLQAEFDCLGVVTAPEERKRRFRSICEQMIKFRIDSGSIYDLLSCLRSDYLAAEGVAVYAAMCDSSFSEKLPIPKAFKDLVNSCVELPRPGQPREREDFMFQCRDKVVAKVKAFIAEKPAMAPVQAVILELLESTLTRSVLLKHGLSASSVSLKVGALYAQCFPVSGTGEGDESAAALIAPDGEGGENVVPIPSAAQIIAFFRKSMDGGVTPEQLKCLGGMLSIWEDHLPLGEGEEEEAAASPLSQCWLMLFSTMVQAGMTQDMIDLRRKYTKKEILGKEDEAALCKSLPSQVAAAFVLASSSENKQELASDLLSSPSKTPEPLEEEGDSNNGGEDKSGADSESKEPAVVADEGRDIVLCKSSHVPSRGEIERRRADEEQLYRIAMKKNNIAKFARSYTPSVLAKVAAAATAEDDSSSSSETIAKIVDVTNAKSGQQPRAAAFLGCYYNPTPKSFIHTTAALSSLNKK